MNSLLATVLLAICLWATVQDVNANCPLSEYSMLIQVYKECSAKQRTMDNLNQERLYASGRHVLNIFNNYCKNRNKIHVCVNAYLSKNGCDSSERAKYTNLAAKSDSFCGPKKAKQFVIDMFKHLPSVGTLHSGEDCMDATFSRKGQCTISIMLDLSSHPAKDIVAKQEKILEGMKCTIQGFKNMPDCPMDESVITTTLAYAQSIVPPTLGIDISPILQDLEKFKKDNMN